MVTTSCGNPAVLFTQLILKYYMKINKCSSSTQYPILILIVIMLSYTASCIKDSDETELPIPSGNDSVLTNTDSTQVVIDSVFKASSEYMYGEWMAQYTGVDLKQMKICAIRRIVLITPEGVYDSHVQGIADIADTITAYKEFEHEHGTCSFDVARQIMKYTIEYDSLINFENDLLEFCPGKMLPEVGLVKEYDEEIWFSKEKEGKRDWIRKDENLVSTDNHSANIIYFMKNQQ